MFLLHEQSKGTESFWHPYISVMNTADLVANWQQDEMSQFMDTELMMNCILYKSEIEAEWLEIKPILEANQELFPGVTKDLFVRMYNYACTRCFGWTLPSTMMVPLADFMNHLPIDTNYDVYSKNSHEVKQSINGEKTQARKTGDKKTDYSQLYKKEFAEDSVDPHYTATIKGQLGKKKTKAPREEII